ncbi:MAG: hypothetical protein [Caudoviricetes sp.]|nr:MAG: hypothetical protein [Caudoviricetes sp.]
MIKVFVLIISMSHGYQGSAIDHVEFDLLSDCNAAGQAFVVENKSYDHSRFICVTKNKVQNVN